ncbi:MAG: hypothetical protein IJS96_08365 [Schwartzia sp.]|nr:hypothetical protein [Schwartzia sp. (in: firmicutes)]
MNLQEVSRFILFLQAMGWTGDEINRFLLFIESGQKKYLPKEKDKKDKKK